MGWIRESEPQTSHPMISISFQKPRRSRKTDLLIHLLLRTLQHVKTWWLVTLIGRGAGPSLRISTEKMSSHPTGGMGLTSPFNHSSDFEVLRWSIPLAKAQPCC